MLTARSTRWPEVERAHKVKQPYCVCCAPGTPGTNVGAGLQVHHIFPFHYCVALGRPDLELDDRNLITLCEDEPGRPALNHHLLVGHLDSFQSSNLDVLEDATHTFQGMTADAIRSDPRWTAKVVGRLKPLDKLSPDEKTAFTQRMNATFPPRP